MKLIKKIITTTLFSVFVSLTFAQGIKFEHGLNWEQAKVKAKAERKYIFVDCYATWCGPCKWMSTNIFPKPEVGEYFNSHFINLALQMDHTDKDSENIRSLYNDVKSIEEKYSVNAYPTYLFLNSEGELVHKIVAVIDNPVKFIEAAAFAFDSGNEYSKVMHSYKNYAGDSTYLRHAFLMAIESQDKFNARKICDLYLDCIKNPISPNNIGLLKEIDLNSSKSRLFKLYIQNLDYADHLIGEIVPGESKTYFTQLLSILVSNEELEPLFYSSDVKIVDLKKSIEIVVSEYPMLSKQLPITMRTSFANNFKRTVLDPIHKDSSSVNWIVLNKTIKAKFPGYNVDTALAFEKVKFYGLSHKNESKRDEATLAYLKNFGGQLSREDLNNVLWYWVFLISKDAKLLIEAIKLGTATVDTYPNVKAEHVDTYANLLYKGGNSKDAIQWEVKAVKIAANPRDKKSFEESLQKMKNKQKTW